MPEPIQKRWERLEKRVLKFNEANPEAHILCIAVVDNYYRSAGNQQMKIHFAESDVVKTKYREVIEGQSVINQNDPREERVAEEIALHDSVQDSLSKHCFDMDMNEIRAIITAVLSPSDRPQGTGRMRGFYNEANCPSWWRETSVPFASLNNPRAGQTRATIEDGYKLIESLQEFCQVYPPRPTKMANSSIQFRSRFYHDLQTSDCSAATMVSAPVCVSPEQVICTQSSTSDCPVMVSAPVCGQPEQVICSQSSTSDSSAAVMVSAPVCVPPEPVRVSSAVPNAASEPATIRKNFHLENLLEDEEHMDFESIMKILGSCDWEEFLALGDTVIPLLGNVKKTLCNSVKKQLLFDVDKRYKDFVPESIESRVCLATRADGNCVYNSISLVLYGDQSNASLLRLCSAINMKDKVLDYSKYIFREFGDEYFKWTTIIQGPGYTVSANITGMDHIEIVCREEILATLKYPYRDCSLFHLHMICELLGRPVANHYKVKNRTHMPLGEMMFPPIGEVCFPPPIHLVWVPVNPKSKYASLTHVVPAVTLLGLYGTSIEECAFEGLGCCAFMCNANPGVEITWVECSKCGQWLHDTCMKIDAAGMKEEDIFLCGCEAVEDGKVKLKSIDWYSNLSIKSFKRLVNVKDVLEDKTPSIRPYIFRNNGFRNLRRIIQIGRFGPFQENLIENVLSELTNSSNMPPEDIFNIFLPETLLRIIERREGLTRLLSELILTGKYH